MQYIPMEKRSRQAQKAYHAQHRGSWYGVNPVSRVAPDKKKYDRNRMKQNASRLYSE